MKPLFSFLSAAALMLTASSPRAEESLLKPFGEAFAAWTDGRPTDAIGSLE